MVPTTTPEFDKKTDNRMPRKFRKVESHSKKMAVKKMYHRFEANSGLKMYAMQVAIKVTAAGYHGDYFLRIVYARISFGALDQIGRAHV